MMSKRLSIMPVLPRSNTVISGMPPRRHLSHIQLTTSCLTSEWTRKSPRLRSPSLTWRSSCNTSLPISRDHHLQNIQRTIMCQTLESIMMSKRLWIMPVPLRSNMDTSGMPLRRHQSHIQSTTLCPTSVRTRSLPLLSNRSEPPRTFSTTNWLFKPSQQKSHQETMLFQTSAWTMILRTHSITWTPRRASMAHGPFHLSFSLMSRPSASHFCPTLILKSGRASIQSTTLYQTGVRTTTSSTPIPTPKLLKTD